MGWKIDYKKLLGYLKNKYSVETAYYFGGVEIHKFPFSYLKNDTVPLNGLEKYLTDSIQKEGDKLNEAELLLMGRHLQRVRFYQKLESFGYTLLLKPVKMYRRDDGGTERKANCDVDLAFYLMREKENFNRAIILSGDGDFLPVFKHLKEQEGKEIIILSRGPRTAREIRQFAGSKFRDFVKLKEYLQFEGK